MGLLSKLEDKQNKDAQKFVGKDRIEHIDDHDLIILKEISSDLAGLGAIKGGMALTLSNPAGQATVGYLSALVKQNWIIIRQLYEISSLLQNKGTSRVRKGIFSEVDPASDEDIAKSASSSDSEDTWEERILCDDGNCIGVIGPDGFCNVCGKPSQDHATNAIGGDVKTLLKKGLALSNSGQYSEALKAYDSAIQADPKQVLPYYSRAVVYNKIGDSSQALEDLKSAAKLGHVKSQELLKSKGIGW